MKPIIVYDIGAVTMSPLLPIMKGNPVLYYSILYMAQQVLSIAIYHTLSLPKP